MDYSVVFAMSMLVIGLALIVAELFLPSGGIISLLSVICIGVSIYSIYNLWYGEYPHRFWWFLASVVGLIPATTWSAFFLLSRTRLGNRVFLEAPNLADVTPYSHEAEERKQLIGKQGKTLTLMSPGGLVVVEGRRLHAETEGEMLDPDQPVQILSVKGNRVVVRLREPTSAKKNGIPTEPHPANSSASPPESQGADFAGETAPVPLDFEIPES